MNHSSVATVVCLTCHNGAYTSQGKLLGGARAMPSGHVVTNGAACSTCHTTTAWIPASYSHTGVTPTTCGTCHLTGVSGAKMKTAAHIPTSGNACDSCHKRGYAIGAFANPTMLHAAVSSIRCDTCHNGSYLTQGTQLGGAKAKPTNHIPTTITGTLDCNTCHTSTTLWTAEKMNHNGAPGKTGVLCITCHVSGGTAYLGNMQRKSLTHDSGGHSDCSDSGCHKPLGNIGTSWVKWN